MTPIVLPPGTPVGLEGLVLDGLDLNNDTLALESLDCPPPAKRQEWAQGADVDGALLVRDPLFDNRVVTVRVRVAQQATMDAALALLGALSMKLEEAEQQPDGLALVWTPATSTKSVTFYVLSGEVDGLPLTPSGPDAGWWQFSPVITLKLTCKPFGYGSPVTSAAVSSATPFVTLVLDNVPGDVPAEGRLLATDAASQSRRYAEWGLEQRYYDPATSLLLDSDSLVVTGFSGAQTTRTGAYDPNATGTNVTSATLYAQPTVLCGTGNLSHVGTFRVKARVFASVTDVRVRLSWQEGDGPFRASAWATPPAQGVFSEVDLGLVTIPPKQLGTQRWQGRIEAYTTGTAGTDTLDIDYLVLVPAGEGYGKARAQYVYQPGVLTSADNFDSGPGALSSRAAQLGGFWTTSGSATDFTVSGSGDLQRTTTSDTGIGRVALLGSSMTIQEVGVDFSISDVNWVSLQSVISRYVDSSNYVEARITSEGATSKMGLYVWVAGVLVSFQSTHFTMTDYPASYHLRLVTYPTGHIIATALTDAGALIGQIDSQHSAVATGGVLATGKGGLLDKGGGLASTTRHYDNFYVATPAAEPVALYSGRVAEVRSDGAIRQDATGTYYGPVPAYRGSRFLIPPAGDEHRSSRILVKAHRNDIEASSSDSVTDNLTVQAVYTPRYVTVPF